jgi:hypothetical protein
MTTQTACERCGLRAVRKELERDGVVMRFCAECYYGEAGEDAPSATSAKPNVSLPGAEPATS